MFDRRKTPLRTAQTAIRTIAAICVAAGLLTSPARAASNIEIPCKEATEANLDVAVSTLHSVLNTTKHDMKITASLKLLAPRAEAAIREAFETSDDVLIHTPETPLADSILNLPIADREAKTTPEPTGLRSSKADPEMNTVLPGVSDDDLTRYKKQMFRRDI